MPDIPNTTTIADSNSPVLESPTKIEKYGQTSAKDLNETQEALLRNQAKLAGLITNLDAELQRLTSILAAQSSAYAAAISDVENSVDSGYPEVEGVFFDMHATTGVDQGTTTAQLDTEYGQAIIPPINTNALNQLVVLDSANNPLVPKETAISYRSDTSGDAPSGSFTYDEDENSVPRAFDDKPYTAWSQVPSELYLWVQIQYPVVVMSNRMTNAVVLHPYPELGVHLVKAQYQTAGAWTDLFSGEELARRRRWVIPPTAITAVRYCFKNTYGAAGVGAYRFASHYYEWNSSATLAMDTTDWNPAGTLSSIVMSTPSSVYPSASYDAGSPTFEVSLSLLDDNTPQIVEGMLAYF
jgi:hypothetical protein